MSLQTYPNVTDLNLSTGPIVQLYSYGDTVLSGLLTPMILLAIFLVSYMALSKETYSDKALVPAAFITMLSAGLLFGAGVASPFYLILSLIVLAIVVYLELN